MSTRTINRPGFFLLTLGVVMILTALAMPQMVLAAALEPGNLPAGSYTITDSEPETGDPGTYLVAANNVYCTLTETTDIIVPFGDLTLAVNTDATIHTIKVNNGGLTKGGSNKLTVTGNGSYAVWTEGAITIDGKLVSTDSVYINSVPDMDIIIRGELTGTYVSATGSIMVKESGVLKTTFSGVAAGSDITVNGKLESAYYVYAGGDLTVSGELSNTGASVQAEGDVTVSGTLISSHSDECGIVVGGALFIDGGTIEANNNAYAVCVDGDITITSGSLTASDCEKDSGVYTRNGNLMINGGTLTANGNAGNGVYVPKGDITINRGLLTAQDNGDPSVYAGSDDYSGSITVAEKGTLESTGVSARGNITVSGTLKNTNVSINAQSGLIVTGKGKVTSVDVSYGDGVSVRGGLRIDRGSLTAKNNDSRGVYAGSIDIDGGGSLTATGNGAEDVLATFLTKSAVAKSGGDGRGNIKVINGELIGGSVSAGGNITVGSAGTLEGTNGVFASGDITAAGKLTGTGEIYGVRAEGDITAEGPNAVIKGVAKTRGRDDRAINPTASVYSWSGTISAKNGGVIWEDYTGDPVRFDDIEPQHPYVNGKNIENIANYTWTPSLIVTGTDAGKGLLATANRGDVTVTGSRTGHKAGEPVKLGASGTHKITFKGNLTASPAPVPALTVTPSEASLEVDETVQLTASEAGVTWASADEKVATVDVNGLVTAVGAGEATVTATAPDGRTASCRVTVTKPEPLEEFDIGIEVLAVKKGKELILPVMKGYKGTWASADPSVARVGNGQKRVKALKVGQTTLTFRVDEVVSKKAALVLEDRKLKAGDSYTIAFNVRKAGELPKSVTLDAKKLVLELAENKAVKLTATVKPAKALDKEVFWTSNKPGVATVDQDGNVTAVGPGTCKITAVSANLKRKTITVTVLGAVTKVTVSPKKQTLQVGDTFTLTATVNEDALDKAITWSSGKPGVASVDEHGVVTARGKGTTKITATASNGKKAACTITVK